jgi:hypothetical protein
MANVIKSKVTTQEGIELPSAYVEHPLGLADLTKLETEGCITLRLVFWASKEDKEAGFKPIVPIYSKENNVPISLTYGINGITNPVDGLSRAQAEVTAYLQTIYEVVE